MNTIDKKRINKRVVEHINKNILIDKMSYF